MKSQRSLLLALPVFLVAGSIILSSRAYGQIIPDNSLGAESSAVIKGREGDRIEGGAVRGVNLFHSFREFNVNPAAAAYFTNPSGIENILSRVTGGNISNIFGTLGVLGNANLFLINPAGIVFGPESRLDLGGSFVGTSASSVVFDGGWEFNARDPQVVPLLRISIPRGLNLRGNDGKIMVAGPGTGLRQEPDTGSDLEASKPKIEALQVPFGQTMALVGSEVVLSGAKIVARSGRVELWSVVDGSLQFTPDKEGLTISNPILTSWGDITLEDAAAIEVRSGNVQLRGRRIKIADESGILVNSLGDSTPGNINIVASESLDMEGVSKDGQFSSGLFGRVEADFKGSEKVVGGDIMIEAPRLTLRDGAQISTSTFGAGKAGTIRVRSHSLEVIGFNNQNPKNQPSGLFANVDAEATGNGGEIMIETQGLTLRDGGQIATTTFGNGNAGSMTIQSEEISLRGVGLRGRSGIFANAIEGKGAGGNLTINAQKLTIADGGTVAASNFQSIDGPQENSGAAGNIVISVEEMKLENSARIAAEATAGDRGNISINSSQLLMDGNSAITTNARGTARGGNIAIATDTLIARENSDISANAIANFGGRVSITAQGIFGTAFREANTPKSDITATSQLGAEFNGIVEIKTPDVDPSAGLILLSEGVVDAEDLIGQDPCLQGKESEFIITGRGGLPPNPDRDIITNSARVSWIEPVDRDEVVESTNEELTMDNYPFPKQIVPARGWIFQADGSVLLVGYDPTGTLSQRGDNTQKCKRSRD